MYLSESERKVDITQQQKVEVSPYDVDLIGEHTHAHTHARTHTRPHTHACTHAHTHTHTHMHCHTNLLHTETQQRVVAQPMAEHQTKVVTKKVVTKTVEVVEDTEPLIEEDRMSGESQVFEATFGISDLESEEPPDSDFNF